MKLIVGLGNPGSEYAKTKHNVGWMFVDRMAERIGATGWKEKEKGMVAEGRVGAEKVLLVKPMTYMNNSGECVGPLMRWYKLGPEDVLVVHDDMDIPAGTIRIRKKGSAGGHNGIKSLIAHIGSEKFIRVRIGIGRPLPGWTVINHVLEPFAAEDVPRIAEAIEYLQPAVDCIINEDVDMAMNRYNPKKVKKAKNSQQAEAGEQIEKAAGAGQAEEAHDGQTE
ncbi:MAG: aminoacyl-tRNA hydrolase [Selenomonadaceae bacterium]|nr:aminoacyl-tRNA hydrolase [Selenomonadaceae bacterium]